MSRPVDIIALALGLALLGGARTPAQCDGTEAQKLVAGNGASGDGFGWSVAVSGAVAVVGAEGYAGATGTAYVYRRQASGWALEQQLFASDGQANDWFGDSVAVSGDVIVVGAIQGGFGSQIGKAYVFRFDGAQWNEEQKLTASDAATGDFFGTVACSGGVIVVGARSGSGLVPDSGAAYVYRYDGAQWNEEQKLVASDRAANHSFGWSSLDGDVAVVGAPGAAGRVAGSGAAYVFRYDGVKWNQEQKVWAGDGASGDSFGTSTAVSGDLAVVGAWFDDDAGFNSGSAYRFQDNGTRWVEAEKFTASDGESWDNFGLDVAVDGSEAVLGAPGDDDQGQDAGAVYAFGVPDLVLDVSATSAKSGDKLSFETCGGFKGGLVLLVAVDVNGAPAFLRVAGGAFDAAGRFGFNGTVPPGLSGLTIGFQSFGFRAPALLGTSAVEAVAFQ